MNDFLPQRTNPIPDAAASDAGEFYDPAVLVVQPQLRRHHGAHVAAVLLNFDAGRHAAVQVGEAPQALFAESVRSREARHRGKSVFSQNPDTGRHFEAKGAGKKDRKEQLEKTADRWDTRVSEINKRNRQQSDTERQRYLARFIRRVLVYLNINGRGFKSDQGTSNAPDEFDKAPPNSLRNS